MNFAILTPSYGPDLERCRLLCRSIDRFATGRFHHYILCDRRDAREFATLEGPGRTVLTVEAVLPRWLRRPPLARSWWLSARTTPVRNWVLQQVVKLSASMFLDEEAFVFIDSDVAFFRPFAVDMLERGGRLRLFRVPGAARLPTHVRWHRSAARLLVLPPTDYFGSTYIGNLISWRRDVLSQLHRRIESVAGRPWVEAVCGTWHLSEYILYGAFVDHVLGADAGHFPSAVPLSQNSWDYRLETNADLRRFFAEARAEHVAVMVSSKLGMPVVHYAALLAEASGRDHVGRPQPTNLGIRAIGESPRRFS